MVDASIYIHIPFCIHRCGYCDFNTYAGLQHLILAYRDAVCQEIEYLSRSTSEQIQAKTIYFGGGTPSLIKVQDIEKILIAIRSHFLVSDAIEISMEANPGTVSLDQLKALYKLGITRISLGMQSSNEDELDMLERQHSFHDVVHAVEWAREAGIDNINLDLIFGLPNQDMDSWLTSLQSALCLNPDHLSLYALTIEHGTPLLRQVKEGILPEPDQDLAADMYEVASKILVKAGYIQYEISNWARRDERGLLKSCQHNLQYWRNLAYIGIGAGAHGFVNHFRTINVSTPGAYINRMKSRGLNNSSLAFPTTPASIQSTFINRDTEIGETMMMGLRLVDEGVSSQTFYKRFGISLQDRFRDEIDYFVGIGLLEWGGDKQDKLRLTPNGYLLGNQVFAEFI